MNHMSKVALLVLPAMVLVTGCAKPGDSYKPSSSQTTAVDAKVAKGQEAMLFPVKEGNTWIYETQTSSQYGTQTAQNTVDFTFQIGKVFPIQGGVEFEMNISSQQEINGQKSNEKQLWQLTDKGIFLSAARIRPNMKIDKLEMARFNPPQPFATFPFEEGKLVEILATGPLPGGGGSENSPIGKSDLNLTFTGQQMTDSLEKSYNAYIFEQEQTWNIPGFDKAKYQAELAKRSGVPPTGTSNGTPLPKDSEEAKLMAELEPKVGMGISSVTSHWAPKVGLVRLRQEIAINNLILVQIFKLKKFTLK